jgi:hypothetical protein
MAVLMLAPLFMAAAGGDRQMATIAAAEAIASHNPRSAAEFPLIAELIATSLAGIAAIAQSVDASLSPATAQRIRSGGLACLRAADKKRTQLPSPSDEDSDEPSIEELVANVEAAIERFPAGVPTAETDFGETDPVEAAMPPAAGPNAAADRTIVMDSFTADPLALIEAWEKTLTPENLRLGITIQNNDLAYFRAAQAAARAEDAARAVRGRNLPYCPQTT